MEGTCGLSRMAMCKRHRCLATSLVSRRRCTALRFLPHVAALFSLQRPLPAVTKGLDTLPCLPNTRGALQPAASPAMQMQATRAFHTTLPDKINRSIIIVIIVMQPVSLCRPTPPQHHHHPPPLYHDHWHRISTRTEPFGLKLQHMPAVSTFKAMKTAKAAAPPKRHLPTKAKKVMPAKKAMKVLKVRKSMKAAKADTPATPSRRPSSGDGKGDRSEQICEQISEKISDQIGEQISGEIAKAMKGRTPDSGGAAQPAAPDRVFQPPAKKCRRTTEESQPSVVADLIIPRELVPIKKALTESIEASGDFDEEEFKLTGPYSRYAEWRRNKSLLELPKVQQRLVYDVFRAFLAMYHEEVPVQHFHDSKINAAKAKELYVAYCQNAVPLTHLRPSDMVRLAWAIREQQQRGEGHFLPHAQRYLEELKALVV